MTGPGVAWGHDTYIASDDAADALTKTRRSGTAQHHTDNRELIETVADRLMDLSFSTWGFGDSVAFEALIEASVTLGDDRWARFAQGWGRAWVTRSQPFARLDCTAPGRALVGIAERYNDAQLLRGLRDLADYLIARPQLAGVFETWESSPLLAPYSNAPLDDVQQSMLDHPPAGVFVDCLHFDPPFLVELGRVTGEQLYLEIGVEQALGYIRLLQRPDGLFDHFALRGVPGTFGPGWGRGQGWAMLGLLEVAHTLRRVGGPRHPAATAIESSVARLLSAMLELQRPDGHWFAVVSDPDSGDEFSTAAFMAAALARAIELGIVEGDHAMAAQKLAREATLASLDVDGQLREVSAAVYASTEPSHYGRVPRGFVVPWGQGPALLALVAKGVR